MAAVTQQTELDGYRAARVCIIFYLCSLIGSFSYILMTGIYNGDFYGVPETIGLIGQLLIFVASALPYALAWGLYKFFKAKPQRRAVQIPVRKLTITFFVIIIWFIILTIKYDVGVLGKEIYDAPSGIKFIIQISNRFNPFYLGVLFIICHRGSRTILVSGIMLLIVLGILRAGLGVFLYIFLALIIRNYNGIKNYIRRNRLKFLIFIIIFPMLVSELYSLRNHLRKGSEAEVAFSVVEILTARLMGRLSSVSNSALVFQETSYFETETRLLDPFYFQRQAFGGVFGVKYLPEVTPERMLINVYGGDYKDVSFMVGLPGNFYMSWLISPVIAMLNLITVIAMSIAVFYFARKLKVPFINEYALILLLYPLTSGVSNEFSSLVVAMVSFWFLFTLLNVRLHKQCSKLPCQVTVVT